MGDTLIERLDRDMASWKSIEIRLDTDHLNSDGGGDQYAKAVFKLHYIETGVGQRFKEELHLPEGGQAVLYRHYGDGTRCADESFAKDDPRRQTQVEIKRTFGIEARAAGCERLPGLSVYYLGDVPLARALASSTPLGNQKISGRVCEMFLFPDHNWGESKSDIVVWIDQVTATPVKESFYADESSRKADEPEQTWLAETIEKIDGHDFPVKSSNTLFARGFQRTAPKAFQHHRPGDVMMSRP